MNSKKSNKTRKLFIENLEIRELLSVSPIALPDFSASEMIEVAPPHSQVSDVKGVVFSTESAISTNFGVAETSYNEAVLVANTYNFTNLKEASSIVVQIKDSSGNWVSLTDSSSSTNDEVGLERQGGCCGGFYRSSSVGTVSGGGYGSQYSGTAGAQYPMGCLGQARGYYGGACPYYNAASSLFVVDSLASNQTYSVRLAYDAVEGGQAFTEEVEMTTQASPIKAVASGPDSVTVSWDFDTAPGTNVVIQQCPTNGDPGQDANWSNVGTGGGTTRSLKISGLREGEAARYRILYTPPEDTTVTVMSDDAIAMPSSISVSKLTPTSATLTWGTVNVAKGTTLTLEKSVDSVSWTTVKTKISASTKSYNLSKLASNQAEYYRLTYAVLNDGVSTQLSKMVRITTPATAPTASETLKVVPNGTKPTSLTFSWVDKSNNETGFLVEQYDSETKSWQTLTVTGANVTTVAVEGLLPKTRNQFRVTALGDEYQGQANSRALSATFNTAVLVAPTSLKASSIKPDSAVLSWKDTDRIITTGKTYTVEYIEGKVTKTTNWDSATRMEVGSSETFDLTDLKPATTYSWRVVSEHTEGTIPSNSASFKTPALVLPTSLKASSLSPVSATLSWKDVDKYYSSGKTFSIEYMEGKATASTSWANAVHVDVGNGMTLNLQGLNPNTTYSWRVVSDHAAGSATAKFSTFKTTALSVPANFKATIPNASSSTIHWTMKALVVASSTSMQASLNVSADGKNFVSIPINGSLTSWSVTKSTIAEAMLAAGPSIDLSQLTSLTCSVTLSFTDKIDGRAIGTTTIKSPLKISFPKGWTLV